MAHYTPSVSVGSWSCALLEALKITSSRLLSWILNTVKDSMRVEHPGLFVQNVGGKKNLIFGEYRFILKMVESINPGAFLWSLHVLHVSATASVLVLLLPLSLKTFGEQR